MSERMFTVLVPQLGKPAMAYPLQTGDKALANMQVLKNRGHEPIARTTANLPAGIHLLVTSRQRPDWPCLERQSA